MRPAVNPAAPIGAGETAGRVALETTRAGAHSRARRRVNGVKAASTRPTGGMHSTATAETSATVKTAAMRATKTSATVKASTAAAVEPAAEARLPARGEPSGNSSMIKAAERAGMTTRLDMRRRRSTLGSYKSMLRR